MRVRTGTSGFSYKGWKGHFYPEDLADAEMLPYYAGRLATVEINNTFYRLPKAAVVAHWGEQVGGDFSFAIKASQRITHMARLKPEAAAEPLAYLWKSVSGLGERLGALLFQLPPNLKRDDARLAGFLALLPPGCPAVIEARHDSWHHNAVHDTLRALGVALCIADGEGDSVDGESGAGEGPERVDFTSTADRGYLRLRREIYDDAVLTRWVERVLAEPWREVLVYFKHEVGGPALAARFAELARERGADG